MTAATTSDATETQPQSAAAPSPFPPIADYAFLSNCHTGALIAPDGAVDWLCVPSFDSPSVFGSLLDRQAGFFRFGPFGIAHPTARAYEPGTNVLVTTWKTPSGWVLVRDALTMGPWDHEDAITPHTRPPADDDADHMLIRTVECIDGHVEVELVCEPVFDYGRVPAEWVAVDGGRHAADASGAGQQFRLQSDLALGIQGERVRARHVLQPGDRAFCALSWAEDLVAPQTIDEARLRLKATTRFWRNWLSTARIPDHQLPRPDPALGPDDQGPDLHADRGDGRRAHDVAAGDARRRAQLGLPLHLDSRHHLHASGAPLPQPELGGRGVHGVRRRPRSRPRTARSRSCTGSTGAATSPSRRATTSPAMRGRSPVRIGNGAFDQRQNDVFGAVLDSILLHTRHGDRLPTRLWPIVQTQAECATNVWREPDQGIWEARGKPQHYVSSKLMCWVALDRAAKLAELRGDPEIRATWQKTADEIRADILEHGVRDGVLRQHYETDALDASNLLAAIFGFLPGDDETLAQVGRGDRHRSDRGRLRPALPHRRDRRRPVGQGGDVPDLLLLARVCPRDRGRGCSGRAT